MAIRSSEISNRGLFGLPLHFVAGFLIGAGVAIVVMLLQLPNNREMCKMLTESDEAKTDSSTISTAGVESNPSDLDAIKILNVERPTTPMRRGIEDFSEF